MARSSSQKTGSANAPALLTPDSTDLKSRCEAITNEIAADIREITDQITTAVLDALAASSDVEDTLRESVFLAIACAVLQRFVAGITDRVSSSVVQSGPLVPGVKRSKGGRANVQQSELAITGPTQ